MRGRSRAMVPTSRRIPAMVTARGPSDAGAPSPAAPPRTTLGKINSHLICALCRGYYIDATTIVECLHTFCRSCIVKHLRQKSYCPVCEMMINSARPNIKLDKALQDIVYKLVPGLFRREMARRRAFYATRPELAAEATPEQRGEDTERIVFSPDDVISFSLEFADGSEKPDTLEKTEKTDKTDASSESGSDDGRPGAAATRRYLRCPAVVNISHLKKFLSLKFDIDAANFFVDILYKRVPLPDYYTLMDVAYIYNWKRIEPMRFKYQISDFSPIRDRFGFLEAGGGGERAPPGRGGRPPEGPPSGDGAEGRDAAERPDVEKSQFLNSFELKAKVGPNGSPAEEPERKATPDESRPEPKKRKMEAPEPPPPRSKAPLPPKSPPKATNIEGEKEAPERKPTPSFQTPKRPSDSQPPAQQAKMKRPNDPDVKPKTSLLKTLSLKRKPSDVGGSPTVKVERCGPSTTDANGPRPSEPKSENEPSTRPEFKPGPVKPEPESPPNKVQAVVKSEEPKRAGPSKDPQKPTTVKPKKGSGDNSLRSLFNSCNINIPPSLSITLKDQDSGQKQETREDNSELTKQNQPQGNAAPGQTQNPPQPNAPPDKNYLEIIKLPDGENSKEEGKPPPPKSTSQKSLEALVTAKGPIPNLKPISEAKNVPFSKPQTFQQTFLQSLQQQKDKPKYKSRFVHPKASPVKSGKSEDLPDSIALIRPPGSSLLKPQSVPLAPQIPKMLPAPKIPKPDSALDLSTPHPVQTKLGPQQTKALETMQSIAILAKRQCLNQRSSTGQNFSQDSFKLNPSTSSPLRVPIPMSANNHLKLAGSAQTSSAASPKHFSDYYPPFNKNVARSPSENTNQLKAPNQQSPSPVNQNIERSQTRSPSSSPKLVIACPSPKSQSPEQKQFISPKISETPSSQSNLISSSQITSSNPAGEASGSKDNSKIIRNIKPTPINKLASIRNSNSISNSHKSNNSGSDIMPISPQLLAQQAYIRQQLELQTHLGLLPSGAANQWFSNPVVRTHFENIVKSMTQNPQSFSNNHNAKDK